MIIRNHSRIIHLTNVRIHTLIIIRSGYYIFRVRLAKRCCERNPGKLLCRMKNGHQNEVTPVRFVRAFPPFVVFVPSEKCSQYRWSIFNIRRFVPFSVPLLINVLETTPTQIACIYIRSIRLMDVSREERCRISGQVLKYVAWKCMVFYSFCNCKQPDFYVMCKRTGKTLQK